MSSLIQADGEVRDTRDETAADVRDELALVIAEWERLNVEEPWHVDPRRHGTDALHETIAAVLDVATWSGADRLAHERLVRGAAAHGDQRRAQDADDAALHREYHALRAALWRFLRHAAMPAPAMIAAVLRVDVAIGVATMVALRAYHRGDVPPGVGREADLVQQVEAASRQLVHLLGNGGES